MKGLLPLVIAGAAGVCILAGCSGGPAMKPPATKDSPANAATPKDAAAGEAAEIAASLAKLSPEDRKLAEAQRWCAEEDENRLGSMGAPYKVMVKGTPVFLCCQGCKKAALADPDKTLAKVEALRAKAAAAAAK